MNDQTQPSRIRLLLLDEHSLFRASLGHLLASEPDFEVAGECGTPAEALEILSRSPVDVVLLDFDVGREHGSDFIASARQAGYQGRFLIVAGAADVRNSAIALQLGASGIFLKSETPERLITAIRMVGNGGIWIDRTIVRLLADRLVDGCPRPEDRLPGSALDDRERGVILGIVGGLTNRKIGERIGLSESSVKNIVQRLFGKAGVKTRGQLVRAAMEGALGAAQDFIKRNPSELPGTAAMKPFGQNESAPANLPVASQSHH